MAISLQEAQQFNAAAFVIQNQIKNENDKPIEFTYHKFMAQIYMDNSERMVIEKCGQCGMSTCGINRSIHCANYLKANVIYTLPSKQIVKDFVIPKVEPFIAANPSIKAMMGDTDSIGLKKFGERYVYFRSSWDEASGIAISADILINDEVDRSNQKSLATYKTRLDAAKMHRPDLGWWWKFSNPSLPGYGVDEWWQESDQKHWMITCSRCNKIQDLTWPENIDFDKETYICKHCKRQLRFEDRINGRWVKKRLGSNISGYWISQLMVPWHSAAKIIEDSKGDQSVFYNFTLGLPYQSKDQSLSRGDLIKCIVPTTNLFRNNAMGVDNGVIKHYVIGNETGIFRYGKTEDIKEIEALIQQYDCHTVIDVNPYPTWVLELISKYPGKVFGNYYSEDSKEAGVVRWGEGDKQGIVLSDRTKVIDEVVSRIMNQGIKFNMTITELDEYIAHWMPMFRIIVETDKGIKKPAWFTPEGKANHWAHATVYWTIAMLRTLSSGKVYVNEPEIAPKEYHPVIMDNKEVFDISSLLKDATQR